MDNFYEPTDATHYRMTDTWKCYNENIHMEDEICNDEFRGLTNEKLKEHFYFGTKHNTHFREVCGVCCGDIWVLTNVATGRQILYHSCTEHLDKTKK